MIYLILSSRDEDEDLVLVEVSCEISEEDFYEQSENFSNITINLKKNEPLPIAGEQEGEVSFLSISHIDENHLLGEKDKLLNNDILSSRRRERLVKSIEEKNSLIGIFIQGFFKITAR